MKFEQKVAIELSEKQALEIKRRLPVFTLDSMPLEIMFLYEYSVTGGTFRGSFYEPPEYPELDWEEKGIEISYDQEDKIILLSELEKEWLKDILEAIRKEYKLDNNDWVEGILWEAFEQECAERKRDAEMDRIDEITLQQRMGR